MRALLLTALLLGAAFPASAARQIIGSEQDHSLAGGTGDCESFYSMTFTSFPAQLHDRQQREIPLSHIDLLRVTASAEGGVTVRGWNRAYARLVVCRYAVAQTKEQAARLLGAIDVSHTNGDIIATGPRFDDTQAWWANITLYVPRRASVEVRAENGGIAIRNMAGRVTARSSRGGISVAHSSGFYKVNTGSGGITLERVTGNVDASSQNGAIALKLAASEVATIEAKVGGGGAGEVHCTLPNCDGTRSVWGSGRKALRIGVGVPDIRLSTADAPITIAPVNF